MLKRLVPSIIAWLVVVITLALSPTIETYNSAVTTNVSAAVNSAYMIGMTAIDDFGGFLIIMGLLISGGFFSITAAQTKDTSIQDMLEVIGAVIVTVIALAMYSGTVIGYLDALITAASGFAQTAYGILTIILYIGIIAGGAGFTTYKTIKKRKKGKKAKGATATNF